MLDRQWRGAELRIRREKLAELVEHRLAQPRQCDMRREFALLGLEADADQRLLDLVAQGDELGMALDPDPQRARLAAAEHAGAGKLQGEAARAQAQERLVDIGGDALIDLADKAQRQMEIAGIDPSRARDARFRASTDAVSAPAEIRCRQTGAASASLLFVHAAMPLR